MCCSNVIVMSVEKVYPNDNNIVTNFEFHADLRHLGGPSQQKRSVGINKVTAQH